jgi:hypothetical protein
MTALNEILIGVEETSLTGEVNYVAAIPSLSGSGVSITADTGPGGDTSIPLSIFAKGTGDTLVGSSTSVAKLTQSPAGTASDLEIATMASVQAAIVASGGGTGGGTPTYTGGSIAGADASLSLVGGNNAPTKLTIGTLIKGQLRVEMFTEPGDASGDFSKAFGRAITEANLEWSGGNLATPNPRLGNRTKIMSPPWDAIFGPDLGAPLPDILGNTILAGTNGLSTLRFTKNIVSGTGALFTWVGLTGANDLAIGSTPVTNPAINAGCMDLEFYGDLSSTVQLNVLGTTGYHRIGLWKNLAFFSIPGQPIIQGELFPGYSTTYPTVTTAGFHEWRFYKIRANDCGFGGSGGLPGSVITVAANGTSSDELVLIDLRVFSGRGKHFEIRVPNGGSFQSIRGRLFVIEGRQSGATAPYGGTAPYIGNLFQISDPSDTGGNVTTMDIEAEFINAYPGYAALQATGVTGNSLGTCKIAGSFYSTAANVIDADIQRSNGLELDFYAWGTPSGTGSNINIGSNAVSLLVNSHGKALVWSGSGCTVARPVLESTTNPSNAPVSFKNGSPIGLSLASFANDTAAAAGGIAIGQMYRNGSVCQIRVS